MSNTRKIWKVLPERDAAGLRHAFPSRLVRQLLVNRGIEDEESARSYLKPDYGRDLHDPFLFRDMEKAVERVLKAVDAGERIMIYGDYDADGVCASVIIASTLEYLGAEPYVHFPHRLQDGYGVKEKMVESFAVQGVNLLITADCGISSCVALERARTLGIDVIIVDHHRAPDSLPPAYAIIHCNLPHETYPFPHLAAGGVAFKFAQGLLRTARLKYLNHTDRNIEAFEKWLLDLVAVSTVADVVPLIGENRTLLRYGLHVLGRTRRVGLLKLIERVGLGRRREDGVFLLDTRNIAFQIAPRLNAAGRMQHASLAYKLLRTNDERSAEELTEQLEQANRERQHITDIIFAESMKQAAEQLCDHILITFSDQWSPGVVGLVAGKLVEAYYLPAFVIGRMNGLWTGSCRAIVGFNCIDVLEHLSELLDHWGGHAQAAGFTLRQDITPQQFAEAVCNCLLSRGFAPSPPELRIDARAQFSEIDQAFVEAIESFAPFGEGNPTPMLCTFGCFIHGITHVGSNGQHVKCTLGDASGVELKAIAFNLTQPAASLFREGGCVDVVYEPKLVRWNGIPSLELYVRDCQRVS